MTAIIKTAQTNVDVMKTLKLYIGMGLGAGACERKKQYDAIA